MRDSDLYLQMFRERFKPDGLSEEEEGIYQWMLGGPKAYCVEDEMILYLNENPNCSLRDIFDYFNTVAPDGYPPGYSDEEIAELKRFLESDPDEDEE